MEKRKKFYQLLDNETEINGSIIKKTTIVYYDENGIEETRENYNDLDVIREGYIPIYLTLDVPVLYETLSDEIKNVYLVVTNDQTSLDEDGNLTEFGKTEIKNKIRLIYSEKISNIPNLRESVERYVLGDEVIPQIILDERETLKTEYHNLISYLGL